MTSSNSGSVGAAAGPVVRRRKTPSSWDPHDDLLLRHLKEQQKLGWKEIAAHFPNRTTNACQFRWRRLVSGTLRSAPQSPQSAHASSPVVGPPAASPLPPPAGHQPQPQQQTQQQHHHQSHPTSYPTSHPSSHSTGWTSEQDELIVRRKDLRVDELALLLGRDERDIQMRAAVLTAPLTPAASADGVSESGDSPSASPDPSPVSPRPSGPASVPSSLPSSAASTPRPWMHSRRCSYFEGLRLPVPVPQRPKAGSRQSSVVSLPPLTPPLHSQ